MSLETENKSIDRKFVSEQLNLPCNCFECHCLGSYFPGSRSVYSSVKQLDSSKGKISIC